MRQYLGEPGPARHPERQVPDRDPRVPPQRIGTGRPVGGPAPGPGSGTPSGTRAAPRAAPNTAREKARFSPIVRSS